MRENFDFELKRRGKYFNEEFVQILNDILKGIRYSGPRKFVNLKVHDFDVSIGFITKEQELQLAKGGLIFREESFNAKKNKKQIAEEIQRRIREFEEIEKSVTKYQKF